MLIFIGLFDNVLIIFICIGLFYNSFYILVFMSLFDNVLIIFIK